MYTEPTKQNPTWINPSADPLGPFASLIRGTGHDDATEGA